MLVGRQNLRKAIIIAVVLSSITLACTNRTAAQGIPAKNIELSLGLQLGLPQGQFDDVASIGGGGHFRAGYWINDRLAIGARVAETVFLPKDFLSPVYQYIDVEWSIFALEADIKYQFLRLDDPLSETTQYSAFYFIARTGYYVTRFTFTFLEEEIFKDSEKSEGYAGGLGIRYIVPINGKWKFTGISLYTEALYYHIMTTPERTNYLLLNFGLSWHFGPKA